MVPTSATVGGGRAMGGDGGSRVASSLEASPGACSGRAQAEVVPGTACGVAAGGGSGLAIQARKAVSRSALLLGAGSCWVHVAWWASGC